MSRIEISLSDSARAFVEEQLLQGSYRDFSEYFEALVREARQKSGVDEVDVQLREALADPQEILVTPEFLEEIESEVARRSVDTQSS